MMAMSESSVLALVNGDISFHLKTSEVMAEQRRTNLSVCGLLPNTGQRSFRVGARHKHRDESGPGHHTSTPRPCE